MDLRSLWRRFSGPSAAGSDAPADASDRPGATGSGTNGAMPAAVERPARPAWRDLEPIPRTVRSHPLVAPTVSFSHGLSGHQPAPLALETLGHDRPADAPAGVVSGLFVGHSPHTPVRDDGGGTARAMVRGQASRPGDGAGSAVDSAAGPPRLAGSPAGAPLARSFSAGGGPAPVAIVPAHRPVVARAVASGGGPAAMTSAPTPSSAAPAGTIGRPAVAGSTTPASRPEPGPGGTPAGLPGGAQPVPSISVTASSVEPGASVLHAGARRNLGQTRRLRIGPAIGPDALDPTDPDRAPAARSQRAEAPMPAAPSPDPLRDLSVIGAAGDAGAPSGPVSTGSASATPTGSRSALERGIAAETEGGDLEPLDIFRTAALTGPSRPVPARPVAPPRPVERAPLVGRLEVGRGSRPPSSDARSSDDGPVTSPRPEAAPRSSVQEALAALSGAALALPSDLSGGLGQSAGGGLAPSSSNTTSEPVQGPAGDGSPILMAGAGWSVDPASRTGSRAAGGGVPTVARSAAGGSASTAAAIARAGGSWAAPIRQLRSTSAPRVEGPRPSGGHAAIGVVASRSFAGAAQGLSDDAPDPATAWPGTGAAAERGSVNETIASSAAPSPVQRLEALAAPSAPAATAGMPTVLRADDGGEGGAGGGAGAGGSDKELDELARKLFPRLQLRLRSELLIDRERIGALVDLGR
jgi:hypothetical protein